MFQWSLPQKTIKPTWIPSPPKKNQTLTATLGVATGCNPLHELRWSHVIPLLFSLNVSGLVTPPKLWSVWWSSWWHDGLGFPSAKLEGHGTMRLPQFLDNLSRYCFFLYCQKWFWLIVNIFGCIPDKRCDLRSLAGKSGSFFGFSRLFVYPLRSGGILIGIPKRARSWRPQCSAEIFFKGDEIMTQGDPGDSLFMSSGGITFPSSGVESDRKGLKQLGSLGKNLSSFCWQAFFGNCRSATEFASHLQFRRGDRKEFRRALLA